jgi:ABC-type nickel/cobalt efflux system permease component RcnA
MWPIGDLYSWVVFIHVASVIAFALGHGVSVAVLFGLRRPGPLDRTRALLGLSDSSFLAVYVAALLIVVFGVVAGVMRGLFTNGQLWLWVSLGLFLAIAFYMSFVRWFRMVDVRHAAGLQTEDDVKKGIPAPEPLSEAEIAAKVARVQPWLVTTVGFGGLMVILALMMFKPF